MTSERKELVFYGLTFALFVSGVMVSVQHTRVGGVFIVSAGVLAMRCHEMAAVQNRLNATRWRYFFGGGATVRPQLFLLLGPRGRRRRGLLS